MITYDNLSGTCHRKTCNTETGGKESKQIEEPCPNWVFYIDTMYSSNSGSLKINKAYHQLPGGRIPIVLQKVARNYDASTINDSNIVLWLLALFYLW